jgi:single-strand DNA-binding protein
MNKVFLMGRFVATPELRTFDMDKLTTEFSLAVDSGYKNANGEKVTDFINCQAYGKRAEFICKYFKKGSPILIEGRITMTKVKKEDKTTTYFKVLVENTEFTYGDKDGVNVDALREQEAQRNSQGGLEFPSVPKSSKPKQEKENFGVYDDVLGF